MALRASQREANYRVQTGRKALTPKQSRRVIKKLAASGAKIVTDGHTRWAVTRLAEESFPKP